jgi:peptide/nickel transport system substrate-binding protein
MLDAAGWVLNGEIREKNGQPLVLEHPIIDRPQDNAMATFLQGSFREVGVDYRVEPLELAAARERRIAGLYDVGFLWFSYADPDILRAIFHSENIGAFNRANYSNPEVDRLLDEAGSSPDPETRAQLYSQIQMRVLEEAVTIPLADSVTINAKQRRLQGERIDYLASYVWMIDARFAE